MPNARSSASFRKRGAVAFFWGFAEATLFFVVPDVAISWLALKSGLRAAAMASLLAAAGAALGGGAIFLWSAPDPERAARIIELVPAISAGAVERAGAQLRIEGGRAALLGAFQGDPYKVWSAAAPAAGWSLPGWMLAAFPVRLPRFLLVAGCFALIGNAVRNRTSDRTAAGLFAAGWSGFYILFWSLTPW